MMVWIWLVASSLGGLYLLGAPPSSKPPDMAWVWLGCAATLDMLAVRTPHFGFLSGAPVLWFGLLSRWPQMAWPALIGAALSLLVRLTRSLHPSRLGVLEALVDWQPLVVAIGLFPILGSPVWLGPLWWILWWLQPASISAMLPPEWSANWCLMRSRLNLLAQITASLAVLATCLNSPSPLVAALLSMIMLQLTQSSHFLVQSQEAEQQTISQRQKRRGLDQREVGLDRFQQGLEATQQKQNQTGAELEARLQTYQLVDEMLQSIPERAVFQAVANLLVERVQQRFEVTNVVLFWLDTSDTPVPVAWVSPHADRVASVGLTQQQEPAVGQALQAGHLVQLRNPDPEGRLFPDNPWSLAVPLPPRGCFYLGHTFFRDLSKEDSHFLEVLSRHAVLALEAAAWYQTLQTSVQRETATAARNEALVQRLALVIDGVTQLIPLRDPQAMLERAGEILRPLIPHDCYFAQSDSAEVCRGASQDAALRALAHKVQEQQLPLLLEQPHRLGVPLLSDQGILGGLVLERATPAFSREDQDILSVLGYQLGAALSSAQLYAELQKTHAALRDSQAQLMQSSKMAAVGQLAGGVAHELNTPLGAVSLAIEAAQMNLQNKPERAAARLERARKAVAQMKEIVSKLLFYSRDARSGWRETNLNEVVEDTLQLVGHQLSLDQVQVLQELSPVPTILANPNELQQVLTNLILNARDAMLTPEARGKKIWISTGDAATGGCWVKLRDQGCGMPTEVMDHIFEPFYTTKEVGKGTGLGLSVSSQLIQKHGGTLQVRSQAGVGTEFEIRLPLKPPEEAH